eukprot:CAMPEP_0178968514 /NCGR_PEP_ID=MMETSP0789-20121207/18315_1 /TAXON_ID=3005 /ORGANISM="Rhizosolenia setigera, Strain CCMP 1694" /LENGTH=397 /DNA_ID=CAMNT_0020654489 /DNA_START=76 /DNA_END=1269 /DNA_ORIENTATION=+
MSDSLDTIALIFELIDIALEFYLKTFITPFLTFHEKFYSKLNKILRETLEKCEPIPRWFTANFITYARTILVIPNLYLMSKEFNLVAALIVILVDFGDFLDGVVARYWVEKKAQEKELDSLAISQSSSATEEEYMVESMVTMQRNKTYGGFVDAVCDKAFVVPCWIYLLSQVSGSSSSSYVEAIFYVILFCLILAEVSSGTIRFRAYFTSLAVPAPKVDGMDFSSSAVKADHVGKAKQTFEMLGTALFTIPPLRYFGTFFLFLAVPLAYESVRRKVTKRVIFVSLTEQKESKYDHNLLKFLMQAKGLGSKLVVGICSSSSGELYENVNATSCVDYIMKLTEKQQQIDEAFLNEHGFSFYVCRSSDNVASPSLVEAKKCLIIGKDDVARCASVNKKTE